MYREPSFTRPGFFLKFPRHESLDDVYVYMKTILHLSVLTFLLTASAGPCFAMASLEQVSPARAKELGMEIRSKPAGPDATWIELEFEAKGALKNFERVSLEITDEGKLLLSSTLKEEKSSDAHVIVSFTAGRAILEKVTLRVVTGFGMRVCRELRLKDFVEPENAASSATPEEQARFLAAVQKAFDARDASGLDALTCYDRTPEKLKQSLQTTYAALLAEKGVVLDFKLVDPDRKFIDKERTEDGVAYRANLPITRQLNIKYKNATDQKTLLQMCFPVGEKDGKLFLLGSAPVKLGKS